MGVLPNQSQKKNVISVESTQEEADTLLILYASELHKTGKSVHISFPDTDVLGRALSAMPTLADQSAAIMGTGVNGRPISLQRTSHALGENRAQALVSFHAISGCDTTGCIFGKNKTAWWNAFVKCSADVIRVLCGLGSVKEPSPDVLEGCLEFVRNLLSLKQTSFNQGSILSVSITSEGSTDSRAQKNYLQPKEPS